MATRTRKGSTPRPEMRRSETPTTTIEPTTSTPTPKEATARPSSRPISPARLQRIQERTELQSLNDRLATYIERVRNLETENHELQTIVEKQESSREIVRLRDNYDKELQDTRNSLDNLARVKAELELKLSREQEDNRDLQDRLKKLTNELNGVHKTVQQLEATVEDLKSKLGQAVNERKKAEAQLKDTADENRSLKTRLEAARAQIENETIMRVDLENRNQTLNEELVFRKNLYIKDVESAKREKRETKEVLIKNIRDQYEEKLAEELQALREENNELLKRGREQLKDRYEEKIDGLRAEISRKTNALNELERASSSIKTANVQMTRELADHKNRLSHLEGKVTDLEKLLERERQERARIVSAKDGELDDLRVQYDKLNEEFSDMQDENIKLQRELGVYNNLLSAEESRMQIHPRELSSPTSPPRFGSPLAFLQRGNKRKRIHIEDEEENQTDIIVHSNASTELEISDQDLDGKFVKLTNIGEKDIGLAGYRLIREASAKAPQTLFKFSRNNTIKAGATLCIWSSNAEGALHNPPTDIIMKTQTWFPSESIITRLLDANNEEIAIRKSNKQITSTSKRMLNRLDEEENAARDGCSIM